MLHVCTLPVTCKVHHMRVYIYMHARMHRCVRRSCRHGCRPLTLLKGQSPLVLHCVGVPAALVRLAARIHEARIGALLYGAFDRSGREGRHGGRCERKRGRRRRESTRILNRERPCMCTTNYRSSGYIAQNGRPIQLARL